MTAVAIQACVRCHTSLAPEDLRCAVCSLPVALDAAAQDRVVAQILRCEGCGAALTYDVEVRAPRCAFCGSVAHLEVSEDPIEQAELYLPFQVSAEEAQQAMRRWLGSLGSFRPSDLQSQATLASLQPLWWVGWTFEVEALVSWAADSDAGARQSDWAPHAGQSPLTMRNVLVSASRGLTEQETSRLAPYFRLDTAQPEPHAIPGVTIERFDVQRSAARGIIAAAVERQAAEHAKDWVPGSRRRNLKIAVLPQKLSTRRYGFPSYVLAYRYRDQLYRTVVHGQDASCVVGNAPYSMAKIALVIGIVVLVLLAIILLVTAQSG